MLTSIVLIGNLYSVPYFSGFVGGNINMNSKEDSLSPETKLDGFLASQLDFSPNIALRLNFSLGTNNIFGENFLDETPATFKLDEIAFAYRQNMGVMSHFLTAFVGTPEPIGSTIFLRRYFSAPDFSSDFLYSKNKISGTQIFPVSGIGGSYIFRNQNLACGCYVYYNKLTYEKQGVENSNPIPNLGAPLDGDSTEQTDTLNTSERESSLNFDFRLALSSRVAYGDFSAGFAFPFSNKDPSGEDVILIVRKAYFHCGFNVFLGSSTNSGLLFQGGLTRLEFEPEKGEQIISLDDIYIFIEPRFVTKKLSFAFAIFNIPDIVSQNLFFISNPLGVNITIGTNNLSIKNRKAKIGGHFTISLPESTKDLNFDLVEYQISPFFNMELGNGIFNSALHLNLAEVKSVKSAFMNMYFTLGYQVKI